MSEKTSGRLHKEDRRGSVADIGRELRFTPPMIEPTGELPAETEQSWGDAPAARTRHPVITGILVLLVAAVVTGIGIGIWLAAGNRTDPAADPGPPLAADLPADEVRTAIETTVRGFLEARDCLDRSQWVVGGEDNLATMVRFYLRPDVEAPQSFGRILDIGPAAFDGYPMHMVMAAEADGVTGHILSVFPVGERMLIDWESSVGLGALPWKKFLADKPISPVQMRVYLKRDNYFNHGFADDSRWDSYRVSARGQPETPPAYVDAASEPGRKLRAAVLPGASQPVNVRLHWADQGRALLITELIHNYWVDVDRLRRLSGS